MPNKENGLYLQWLCNLWSEIAGLWILRAVNGHSDDWDYEKTFLAHSASKPTGIQIDYLQRV